MFGLALFGTSVQILCRCMFGLVLFNSHYYYSKCYDYLDSVDRIVVYIYRLFHIVLNNLIVARYSWFVKSNPLNLVTHHLEKKSIKTWIYQIFQAFDDFPSPKCCQPDVFLFLTLCLDILGSKKIMYLKLTLLPSIIYKLQTWRCLLWRDISQ